MSTVLLILAAICFGAAAFFSAENIGPVKLIPLGLFLWVLAVLI